MRTNGAGVGRGQGPGERNGQHCQIQRPVEECSLGDR